MNWFFHSTGISKQRMMAMLKFSVGSCLLVAAAVYTLVRIIFYEISNSIAEEATIILQTGLVATLLGLAICTVLITVECADRLLKRRTGFIVATPSAWAAVLLIICSAFLYACNGQTRLTAGIKKDITTGLTATYSGMEPEKVLLVMNNEELAHTDIPIGESFLLVNKNIDGLKEKDGMVSVGCSLTITDKNGKKLLDEVDLFKGKDLFKREEVNYLKCTINTGEPMEWEEKYDVVATFWDKYGSGRIVNEVTIRMIDIP